MRTKLLKGALAAVAAMITVTPALAADYRQHNHASGIERVHTAKSEYRYNRHGYLSPRERARIRAHQYRSGRWAHKHDHRRYWHNRSGRNWGWNYGRYHRAPQWR